MPPKTKVTKEEIVRTALDIVRQEGAEALNARNIATGLGCSTQPIFSNFASMDALRLAVAEQAYALFRTYMTKAGEQYPPYKAGGMAYILFAKEEKALFKLLYMCDRTGLPVPVDTPLYNEMVGIIRQNTGLDTEKSTLFHLEMWAFVHGIATMFATGYVELEYDLVSRMLTDAYRGLQKQYAME